MPSILNPYLSFKDNARDAMEFYKSVLGGDLQLSTFKDFQASQNPAEDNLVMHGQLTTNNGMTLMGADTPSSMEYVKMENVSISLSGTDEAELRGYWDKLAKGANVSQELVVAPWGDTFGMLTDKFGVGWLVNISGQKG